MGKTYRRSADESEYYRQQRLSREMEKRNNKKKRRSTNEYGDVEEDKPLEYANPKKYR
jgi:hypothetical protein